MADEQVVEQPQTQAPATTETVKPATTDTQKPVQSATQVTAPDRKAEEDRNRGILADLQKERKARQEFERQVTQYKADLDAERRRIQALVGVTPKSPEETEHAAIRERFSQIYPELAGLTKEDIEALRELRNQSANLQAATEHHWEIHSSRMLDSVVGDISKELGGSLTDRQAAAVKRAYALAAEEDPEFLDRHNRGDQTLIKEFVKNWIDDWFEPARRKVTQTEVERARRVPSGRDRSVATTGGKKVNYSDPKAVEDALVASFREHGGEFGS